MTLLHFIAYLFIGGNIIGIVRQWTSDNGTSVLSKTLISIGLSFAIFLLLAAINNS